MAANIRDRDWLRQSFILPKRAIDSVDQQRRIFNNGYRKFADTTLGGNAAINPPPQFTRYADLKEKRFHQNISRGMGRYYSENIDDNSVLVHMRFGVPTYNSLTQFFGNFYSSDASQLARTGRSTGVLYTIGRIAGFVFSLRFLPWIILGQTIKFLAMTPSTRYYYLKPTMPLYWNAVNMMVNSYAANVGFTTGLDATQAGTAPNSLTTEDVQQRNRLLPEIFRNDGSIDIYSVATRFQRLANKQFSQLKEIRDQALSEDDARQKYGAFLDAPLMEERPQAIGNYVQAYLGLRSATPTPEPATVTEQVDEATPTNEVTTIVPDNPAETVADYYGKDGQEDVSLSDFLTGELMDGAQFVTFKVDGAGTVGESFSNSARESTLASTINGVSSGARNARFSFADGNIDDGVIGQTVGAVIGGVKNLVGGFLDQLSLSGLASLAGNALVDIPKHWEASSMNLPRMQYSIELRSPYGNEMSRFINLMVPLFYLLAGALPRSTGTQSYTSPFLCELYCKGRAQTRLGLIDSLEITRGAGNIGWTQDGKPLGIDVSFSVLDLSSIMHMPLTNSFNPLDLLSPGALSQFLTADDSSFSDYMATLSSLGLTDQVYSLRRLKRNYYKTVLDFKQWASPAHFANWVGGLPPARVLSGLYNATDRN